MLCLLGVAFFFAKNGKILRGVCQKQNTLRGILLFELRLVGFFGFCRICRIGYFF